MKIKDLAKVISSATIVMVYFQNEDGSENTAYEYGGAPEDSFGVIEHFAQKYAEFNVFNIYPSDKDVLEVLIGR